MKWPIYVHIYSYIRKHGMIIVCVCVQIYSSGYVTLGEEFTRCTPGSFDSLLNNRKRQSVRQSGFAMLAPLWSDTHVSSSATFSSYTNVYYHIYDSTDTLTRDVDETVTMNYVLEKAKDDAMNYGGVSDIEPTWVMVITWKNMQPRLWYRPYVEKVCQCFVLMWGMSCHMWESVTFNTPFLFHPWLFNHSLLNISFIPLSLYNSFLTILSCLLFWLLHQQVCWSGWNPQLRACRVGVNGTKAQNT